MPAALDVDHEQFRMLCFELGYEEASRRTGIKAGTLRQWSLREEWEKNRTVSEPVSPTKIQPVTLVTSPAQALASAFRDDMVQTRLGASRVARRAVAALERRDDDELLADGGETMLKVTKNAAIVHDWAGQGNTARIVVSLQGLEQTQAIELEPDQPE